MAGHNIPQGGYLMLELIPVMLVLLLAVLTFVSLLACVKCKHVLAVKVSNFLWTALHKLSRLIFKDVIKEAPSDDDKRPRSVYQGKEVPQIIILMIGAYSFALGLFTAITFWDVFLLRQTYACDDGLDCFPRSKKPFSLLPIQNCSIYSEESTDEVVTCYAFVFQFGTAAGVAGGLITVANHILRGISYSILAGYDKAEEHRMRAEVSFAAKLRRFVIFAQHFIVVLLVLVFIASLCGVLIVLDYFNKLNSSSVVHAVSLLLTIVLALTIPWYKLDSAKPIRDYERLEGISNPTIQ